MDKGEYLSFEEVLLERWGANEEKRQNTTLRILLKFGGDNLLCEINKYFADKGFRRFKILNGKGKNSIVFDTIENQIVKLTAKGAYYGYEETYKSPYVLQPISTEYIGDVKIEIFPRALSLEDLINQGKMGYTEANNIQNELVNQMEKDGLEVADANFKNISLMKNNVAIIIDDGELKAVTIKEPEKDTLWVTPENKWVQDEQYPNIETGKIEGVYAKEDLPEEYSNVDDSEIRKKSGKIVEERIEVKGLYRKQLAKEIINKYGEKNIKEYLNPPEDKDIQR